MQNFLLIGAREWLIILIASYGLTWLYGRIFEAEKRDRRASLDGLSNILFYGLIIDRIILLLRRFSVVMGDPMVLLQGRNPWYFFVPALVVSLVLVQFVLNKKKRAQWRHVAIMAGAVVLLSLGAALLLPGSADGESQQPLPASGVIHGDLDWQDYQDQWVVLNFWASWCPPCRAEWPEMEQFYNETQGKVAFLAINASSTEPNPEAPGVFLEEQENTLPVAYDREGQWNQRWKIERLPTTLVFNPQGELVHRREESLSYAALMAMVRDGLD